MDARFFLNRIKEETGIKTDKELAKAMGVKYGTLTKWIARNSIPKDPLTEFAVNQGIDLKQLVYENIERATTQNNYGSSGVSLYGSGIYNAAATGTSDNPTTQEFKNKLSNYQRISEQLIAEPFLTDLQELYKKYDNVVEALTKAKAALP